ncbi:MAG: acylphosphatase [Cytophagales bacterium]|nr:acylphosphatase [Armatimonadota bacterium]
MTRLHAIVHGRVQGVGYRYFAHHAATRLSIPGGVVRNRADGTVEIEAEAPDRSTLEGLLRELNTGPTAAEVETVETNWEENVAPRYASFRVA